MEWVSKQVCVPHTESGCQSVVKVKVTLVQALRLCTGRTAHRGSGAIALPFYDHRRYCGTWLKFHVQTIGCHDDRSDVITCFNISGAWHGAGNNSDNCRSAQILGTWSVRPLIFSPESLQNFPCTYVQKKKCVEGKSIPLQAWKLCEPLFMWLYHIYLTQQVVSVIL